MKSLNVTTQTKGIEQYFPVVVFIMLYKMTVTRKTVDEILKCDSIQMKAPELWRL